MVRRKTKTSSVNPRSPTPVPWQALYPDLEQWPLRWHGLDQDIPPGQQIVDCFRPFLAHLALSYARSTARRHADNLWILGGEIIRHLHDSPRLRKRPMPDLVFATVAGGGPLPYHRESEQQLRSFEATCRKLRRFLESQRAPTG